MPLSLQDLQSLPSHPHIGLSQIRRDSSSVIRPRGRRATSSPLDTGSYGVETA